MDTYYLNFCRWIFWWYRLYEETLFNQANEAYIKQDYISVRDILENIGVSRMNINTKYILAFSNVKVESLTDEQKNKYFIKCFT